MRTHHLALALLTLSGCSLSNDFDTPFPALSDGHVDAGAEDQGGDQGLAPTADVGPDEGSPDLEAPDQSTLDSGGAD